MKISQLINNSKIRIDKTNIDPSFLMGKDEFLEKLTEMGGTYSDLVSFVNKMFHALGMSFSGITPFQTSVTTAHILCL